MVNEVDFLSVDLQVDILLWLRIARHGQNIQNNNFAVPLQYLKENLNNEVDFLPADIQQRFFQADTIIVGVCDLAFPNYLK